MPELAGGFQEGGDPRASHKEAVVAPLTPTEENVSSATETLILRLPPRGTHTLICLQNRNN